MVTHVLYPEFLQPSPTRLSPASRRLLAGLEETYGPEPFGPGGVWGALARCGPALAGALAPACQPAAGYDLDAFAPRLLDRAMSLLPGPAPDLYLGTLLFLAPAATLSIGGKPAIALGLERFHPSPPPGEPRSLFRPGEAEEMIPHEAAHAVRMRALSLPPTPRLLSLLEMVMLEGTALLFTDLLLGRQTLATFLPRHRLEWHEANERAVRAAAAAEFDRTGMEIFQKYFTPVAPVSGYFVGYSLCREFIGRHGTQAMRDLLTMESREILRRLGAVPP